MISYTLHKMSRANDPRILWVASPKKLFRIKFDPRKKINLWCGRSADSAYPLQTVLGIEMIYVDAEALSVVTGVIAELVRTQRVKLTIYTDAEMTFVADKMRPAPVQIVKAGGGNFIEPARADFVTGADQ